jgi:hypothetical protein
MIGQTVLSLFVVWLHLGFAPTRAIEKPPNKVQRLHFGVVKISLLFYPFNDPKIAHGAVTKCF